MRARPPSGRRMHGNRNDTTRIPYSLRAAKQVRRISVPCEFRSAKMRSAARAKTRPTPKRPVAARRGECTRECVCVVCVSVCACARTKKGSNTLKIRFLANVGAGAREVVMRGARLSRPMRASLHRTCGASVCVSDCVFVWLRSFENA